MWSQAGIETLRKGCPVAVRVLRSHPVTEEYDAVLAGLQRRGFRLELSADDESVERYEIALNLNNLAALHQARGELAEQTNAAWSQ
jgi:hypothetical protein